MPTHLSYPHVINNIQQPAALTYRATDLNITSGGSGIVIGMDGETYDPQANHSTVTNNSRITVGTRQGGLWLIVAQVHVAMRVGNLRVEILLNGTTVIAQVQQYWSAIHFGIVPCQVLWPLADGDYVEMRVFQDTTITIAIQPFGAPAVDDTFLRAVKLW